MMLLFWVKLIVILAAPYFFAGMAISLALTRSPWPVPLIYGVDLIGAATGCLVVLVVLTFVDSVSALFLVGMLGALAATAFSLARRASSSPGAPLFIVARLRIFARPAILATALALLALGNAAIQPYGLKLSIVKNELEVHGTGRQGNPCVGIRAMEFVFSRQRRSERSQHTVDVGAISRDALFRYRAAVDGDRRLGRHEHVPL